MKFRVHRVWSPLKGMITVYLHNSLFRHVLVMAFGEMLQTGKNGTDDKATLFAVCTSAISQTLVVQRTNRKHWH